MRFAPVLGLAAVLTLVNAAKPVVVDDPAYLAFATHIAADPLNPYGFELFWYARPDPAFEILCPPVLPYFLAAGVAVGGGNETWLKLWLFPVAVLLTAAVMSLARLFARGAELRTTAAVVLGPAVLPCFNFMLDVPALALELAALAVFVRGTRGRKTRWAFVLAAGGLGGLAVQTKYSVLLFPAVVTLFGVCRKRPGAGIACGAVAVGVFTGVELLIAAKYGRSHFLFHAGDARGESLAAFFAEKQFLVMPLFAYLGAAAGWVGVRSRIGTVAAVAGVAAVVLLPGRFTTIIPGRAVGAPSVTLSHAVFAILGTTAVLVGGRAAASGFRVKRPRTWLLFGWLLLEIAGYFALTPFPAGRRVLGIAVVLTFALGEISRAKMFAAAVAGFALAGIDAWDARAEPTAARHAAQLARANGGTGTGYYVGHWGFQYYCERGGLRPYLPGRTVLETGDFVLSPAFPDAVGFYRPDGGRITFDPGSPAPVGTITIDDWLSAQTVPDLYGGRVPVRSRFHSRLRVEVFVVP